MKKISVVINTYNAEKHLEEVLQSVASFDEVLICDMESTDRTLEIAQSFDVRVITFKRGDYNIVEPARNFAIQSARYDWVLVVDADEVVPPQLRNRLYATIENEETCPSGLYIPRKNFFMGRLMKHFYPDYQLRFFYKEGTYWPETIHSRPYVKGRIERLDCKRADEALVHLADETLTSLLEKTNRYTNNEVIKRSSKKYGIPALFYRPFWAFFHGYFIKAGFKDGMEGFLYCCMNAIYRFIAVAKIIEARRKAKKSGGK